MRSVFFNILVPGFCMLMLIPQNSPAQPGWQYLPNIGLPGLSRFEDVYFTDTSTGYAVAIASFYDTGNTAKPIYKTTNGGNTWTRVGPAVNGSSALRSIEFLGDNVTGIVGSLNGSVYRTVNAGASWTEIAAGIADTVTTDVLPYGKHKICGIAHSGNNFYAVGWWGARTGRFFRSTDKGVSWSTFYIDTNLASSLVDAVFLSADTGFITGGRSVDGGSFDASSDESVILRTTDGGATWTKVFSDTMLGGRVWKIQAIDKMNLVGAIEPFYFPDSVNIVRSTDGGYTWTVIPVASRASTVGPGDGSTQGVGFVSTQIGWVGGYFSGLFQTTNGGVTWDTVNFGNTFNRFFVFDSNHVFASGEKIYKWTRTPDTSNAHVSVSGPVKQPHQLYPVSPNPTRGIVKIEFDLLSETNVVLQVTGVSMRKHSAIASGRFKPGHYCYYWDSRDMPAGNYLVWLGTDEIPITRKFVLEK